MQSARIERVLETLLDQAEAALTRHDWQGVAAAAHRVLAVDAENTDALAFLHIAEATHSTTATRVAVPPAAPRVAASPTSKVAAPTATTTAATSTATAPTRHTTTGVIGIYGYPRIAALWSTRGAAALAVGMVAVVLALTFVSANRGRPSALTVREAESAPAITAPFRSAPTTPTPDRVPALATPTATPTAATTPASTPAATSTPTPTPRAAATPDAPRPTATPAPAPAARRYSGAFTGTFGQVVAANGCTWDTPFDATIDVPMTRGANGALEGNATATVNIRYVVTSTPPGATCNASSASSTGAGTLSGTDNAVSGSLTGMRSLTVTFSGARQGDALVGEVTMQRALNTTSTFGSTAAISATPAISVVLAGS